MRLLPPLFWAAALAVLALSLWPQPPQVPGAPSDKIQHFLAFAALASLARAAWPRTAALPLFLRLALFGALIEALQAIPVLNRSPELLDWLADLGGAGAVLLACRLFSWLFRRRYRD